LNLQAGIPPFPYRHFSMAATWPALRFLFFFFCSPFFLAMIFSRLFLVNLPSRSTVMFYFIIPLLTDFPFLKAIRRNIAFFLTLY